LLVLCGALGSWSFLAPFLRRDANEQAFSQVKLLADATGQIQKLDQLAGQISGATNQWLELQSHTAQAAESAKDVANRMSAEAKAFTEFMQRAGETEKAHLRVEVEKLRRGEGERLQIIVHILDHVFALFQAARHSGQPGLVEQIGQFHNACRDTARRIGLTQTAVEAGEVYDPQLHQLPENVSAGENTLVAETLAAGYTYQGQLLRRPVVALKENAKG
jgi:molecular chaperone GrpE (heat shock protein)